MKTDILFYKLFEMQPFAMIDTTEIFDDIHESVAVQQYAQQFAQENKLKSVPSLLQFGLSIQQIAEALKLPVETIEAARQKGL
jgi:predicted transposase YdaD